MTEADKSFGPLGPFSKAEAVKIERPTGGLALAAIGLEAEFKLFVDDVETTPEKVFGDPTAFIRSPLVHREGTSYHLPTGGAIYFDTGVIEVATPPVEIAFGCAARAGRILWESIRFVREALDDWSRRTGRSTRLQGFSAHYNVSFDTPEPTGTVEDLAWLLVHVLPAPVMLVAANRRSTGVGVRPRPGRIEVTVDFTPSVSLSIATAALITGITREVMMWPSFALDELERQGIPVIDGVQPKPHTSRKGWLAHATCYRQNPFEVGPEACLWALRDGSGPYTLREIARTVFRRFLPSIRSIANPFTFRLLTGIFSGHTPALLDLPDRPAAYDDVGRTCRWDDLFSERLVPRSLYERVIVRALSGDVLHLGAHRYTPVRPRGWSHVLFRRDDGRRALLSMDFLLRHLEDWERA